MTSTQGFASVLPVGCAKTRMIWAFPTTSKSSPFGIINFIPKNLKDDQHLCKCARVDEDGALAKSTDFTNLLVDDFITTMESTGSDAS